MILLQGKKMTEIEQRKTLSKKYSGGYVKNTQTDTACDLSKDKAGRR